MVYEINRAHNKKKAGMNTDTQIAYRSLASHFYATHLPDTPLSELNEFSIIGALLRAAPGYRPDYFRRLRNALALDQKLKGNFWVAQEINRTRNPVTVLDLPRKRKPARRQRISDEDFGCWVQGLLADEMPVEAGALMLISMTGARPCELAGITVDGRRIRIPGAKHSHGGLRGADRELELVRSSAISCVMRWKLFTKKIEAWTPSAWRSTRWPKGSFGVGGFPPCTPCGTSSAQI